MVKNTEATTDSTPPRDDSIATDSQTEEALLADIVRNSDFVESLPNEQVPEVDTAESEEDPESEEAVETEEIEEESIPEVEETEGEDDTSTQETEVISADDLDLDAKVSVKIDGKETEVSLGEIVKGYSTEQSLSNKGRELGTARQQLEEEFGKRFEGIQTVSKASAALLYREEQTLAKEYHEVEKQIDKARKEGDTYEVGELKDKREQAQKAYWDARKIREALIQQVKYQDDLRSKQDWDKQLQHYAETIPKLIPDYSMETLKSIRDFAIAEGVSEYTLDSIADPQIVKFVDDFRRLKQGITKGVAKRKTTTVKKVPIKKAKTISQKRLDRAETIRQKGLTEGASEADQMNFLRQHAEQSLG
jgi:hypothetical protein